MLLRETLAIFLHPYEKYTHKYSTNLLCFTHGKNAAHYLFEFIRFTCNFHTLKLYKVHSLNHSNTLSPTGKCHQTVWEIWRIYFVCRMMVVELIGTEFRFPHAVEVKLTVGACRISNILPYVRLQWSTESHGKTRRLKATFFARFRGELISPRLTLVIRCVNICGTVARKLIAAI